MKILSGAWRACRPLLGGTLICLFLGPLARSETSAFSSGKVAFSVRYKNEVSSYHVNGVSVLPGEALTVEIASSSAREHAADASAGSLTHRSATAWTWLAPDEVGVYRLDVRQVGGDAIVLNAFVMVPYDRLRDEHLNGYRIGEYPTVPLKQLAIYQPPAGFIEVQPANLETPVSPHFKLGQFLCKQEGDFPKYVVLQERLVHKLELILEEINRKGHRTDGLHVMSGYRTPFYNQAIGNVRYSRHVWGGAADVFVDERPRDGHMDDLNQDGKIDFRDAGVLRDIIDALYGKWFYAPFLGGLARYRATSAHGPFVHVDERGFRARWGS